MTQTKTDDPPTLKEVRRKEERREELLEKLEELEAREAELSQQLAERTAEGEDTAELSEERREVRELREDVELAVDVLAERVEEGREKAAAAEARERLSTIKKKCGGIAGEHPRRMERLEEAVEAAESAAEGLNDAYDRQELLRQEAEVLAERFGLEVPEMKTVLPPARDADAPDLLRRLSGLTLTRTGRRFSRNRRPAERARDVATELEEHGDETPAPKLLEAAGELSEEEWKAERERRQEKQRQAMDDKREKRREEVDTWLRERLSDGPVDPDRVRKEAYSSEEIGNLLSSMGGQPLPKARRRVDVEILVHDEMRGSFWALPDVDTGEDSPWSPSEGGRSLGRTG